MSELHEPATPEEPTKPKGEEDPFAYRLNRPPIPEPKPSDFILYKKPGKLVGDSDW